MAELVLHESTDDGIVTITMNRPEARNALSVDLIDALNNAIASVEKDDAARVMILAGAGKVFCAGMDLKGVLHDAKAMAGMLRGLSVAMRKIRRLLIPTIARVQGAAVGGGCGLMVVTDFAVTHPQAKVGYPEVDLGVCPAVVAPWLIRKIGAGPARRMLLAGGTMSGADGHALGLTTHLVEEAALKLTTEQLAEQLIKGGKHAMSVTKRWLNELDGSMEEGPFERAAELSAEVIAGEEAQTRLRRLFGQE
jgi:methylglutaconyl-CoA hydratase